MVKFANFNQKQQNKEQIQFSHFSLKRTANNNYFIHYFQEFFLLPQIVLGIFTISLHFIIIFVDFNECFPFYNPH
jgi:hypothetical protein